jgi:hypothetical protein
MNIHNWLKQSKKELIYLLILIIFIIIFANYLHSKVSEPQEVTVNYDEIVVLSYVEQYGYLYDKLHIYNIKIASLYETIDSEPIEEEIEDYFAYREDIPLSEELQRHIYDLCEEYQISETLVYAIIKVESNFDKSAQSHTNDSGLMQLNENGTSQWLGEELGIENFDPQNPYHNVEAGIYYLSWLREYWVGQGFSEEDAFDLVTTSYNWGYGKVSQRVAEQGYVTSRYADKVYNAKIELERGE